MALVLGAALLLVALFGLRERVASPLHKVTLVVLRIASVLAAFILATQPSFWGERVRREPGVRAVLVDVSRSMRVATDGPSRGERVSRLVERWAREPAGRRARFYRVGEGSVAIEPAQAKDLARLAPDARSDLGRAVSELIDGSPDLGSIVLVSDGADTSGAALPAELAVKVHSVLVADERPLRDDAIASMHADPVAFLHGEARVQATLRSTGLGGRALEVSLRRGARVVASQKVALKADGEASVELAFAPEALGREVYTLELERDDADDVPENNTRSFLVRVTRERLRVLHVSGRPSWDQRFLRGFLKRDPSIDLVSFFILRSVHDITMSDPSELALIPFPTDELFRQHLGTFDAVILQDFDYAPYQMAPYLPLIRQYVSQGGGLAMIGGSLSFDGGGYAETPLADVLPVRMRPTDPAGAQVVLGPFEPQPVPSLMHHPILELHPDPTEALAVWKGLTPLVGANQLLGAQEGAVVLLEHPQERVRGGARMPVLAVGRYGKGRTLALATDTSWHWSMPTAGRGGDPGTYDRFWDRAVRFLTRDPLLEPARIDTARATYPPGAKVEVSGLARDASYRALDNTSVTLLVTSDDKRVVDERALITDVAGRIRATLSAPSELGVYEVVLMHEGERLCSEPFIVELGGEELRDVRPQAAFMQALATRSEGQFVGSPEDAPRLDELDATRTESLGIERRAPFSQPLAASLLFAVLGLEWALRRRWGVA